MVVVLGVVVYRKGNAFSGNNAACVTMPEKASIARRPFLTSEVAYRSLALGSFEKPRGSKENSPEARPEPLAWSKIAAPFASSSRATANNNKL